MVVANPPPELGLPVQAGLTELQRRALAARFGALDVYARAVHNLEIEPYQLAWAKALRDNDRTLIVCPPDTYKSTTVRLFVEQLIGNDPNERTLWLMNSASQAEKQVMAIKATIEGNAVYREAFGVEPDEDKQWTNSTLYVKRDYTGADPTLMATGLNGPYQGLHFNRIIIDDPTNPEDVRSPTEMEAQRSKLRGVIIDRLTEGGKIIAILTPWGGNDLRATFKEMGFKIIEMPVIGRYPWGETISVRRFSMGRIDEIRRDKGSALFNLTYMLKADAIEGGIIRREAIRYWQDQGFPDEPLAIVGGLDPAASTRTSADYFAFATVGKGMRTGKLYQLGMWAGREEVPDWEDMIVKLASRQANLLQVGVETAGFQLSVLQRLRRRQEMRGIYLRELRYRTNRQERAKVVAMDRDPVARIFDMASRLERGDLLLSRDNPLLDGVSLEDEMVAAPYGRHDDRLMALYMACVTADGIAATPNGQRRTYALAT